MNERNRDAGRAGVRGRSHGRTLAAFTLIEMLVVVAMLGIITVGLAQIFKSAGDTARAGRRVSNINTYATMIERQMRSDFESMTRSGFLVIRNATAGSTAPGYSGDRIGLVPGDTMQPPNGSSRRRRVDEIVFFAKGDFASQRTPVHPDRAPRSAEAMIYYGHGLKWDPRDTNYRADLRVNDTNMTAPGFGAAGMGGSRGPDQYASDWVLARRAFVLEPPNQTPSSALPGTLSEPAPVWPGPPMNPAADNTPYEDPDRNIQIGLQPAALSAFRIISDDTRNTIPTNANLVRDDATVQRPRLVSGIVDVIATNLSEIRGILIDAQPTNLPNLVPFTLETDLIAAGGDRGRSGATFETDLQPAQANSVTRRMHEWMRQAFPADSDNGRRVRLEVRPPDWTGSRDSTNAAPYDKDYKRTDQEMLTAFNFVPHCTEFIVEWSFGKVYPANFVATELRGQVIWHGKERSADLNGDGVVQDDPLTGPELIAFPYAQPGHNNADLYFAPFRRTDGTIGYRLAHPDVIGRPVPNTSGFDMPQYSYFGIIDPTWRVRSDFVDLNNDGVWAMGEAFDDVNGDGGYDPMGEPANPPGSGPENIPELPIGNGDAWYDPGLATPTGAVPERRLAGDPDTVPWPWPRMIRITMSIVDPQEPRNEQTFQFTFEVPSDSDGASN